MRFGRDQLRDKALLALEEAVVECRYGRPRRSHALRFALAYLWASSGADRRPFEDFWQALGHEKTPWSFGVADGALLAIYRALGRERDGAAAMRLWHQREQEELE
ncbi:MAG: hypothetical protein M3177_05095 [Pseudomonadota bacterium]|nr:hypothetical protein [Pseudomonadota bacterium]